MTIFFAGQIKILRMHIIKSYILKGSHYLLTVSRNENFRRGISRDRTWQDCFQDSVHYIDGFST